MIPDETVEQVREAADIVQIIGEHVALKKTGADYRGPCPFHQGTHPNFSVSTRKRMYYCFVCHEGGDVFTFLSKRLGLDWPAAVRYVADKSGIEIRETEAQRSSPDPREPLWEVTGSAAEYFRRMLWEDDVGQPARDYLASRHVDRETADRFGLGYAPPAIGLIRTYLQTLGFDDERQIAAGMLVPGEEGREPRPRFRGRLVFPIFDAVGHTAGFGARLIGPGDVKYVNSPESPIFAKRRLLYGLNWAKSAIRRDERALVVEGYFDVVRLMTAGIEAVVAPLGTALTEGHTELLARYTKQVFLLYDSDSAGLRATFRAGDELLRRSFAVRVVTLPEGEDPDTFVDRFGAERLEAQLAAAPDLLERKVQLLQRAGWFNDLHRKRRAIDRLLSTIRAATDPITQELYVGVVSQASGVPSDLLWREVRQQPPSPRLATGGPSVRTVPPSAERRPVRRDREQRRRTVPARQSGGQSAAIAAGGGPDRVEREVIRALLFARGQAGEIADRVHPERFRDARYKAIAAALVVHDPSASLEGMVAGLSPDAAEIAKALIADGPTGGDPVRVIGDSLAALRVRELEERQGEIDRLMVVASPTEKKELMMEKVQHRDEIRTLHGRGYRTYGKSRFIEGRSDGAP